MDFKKLAVIPMAALLVFSNAGMAQAHDNEKHTPTVETEAADQ